MLAVLRRNPVALGLAILLHIALAVFLILEVDWRDEVKPIGADVVVVQATLVDQQELDAAVAKRETEERAEVEKVAAARRAEQEKAALEKRRTEEKRKLAEIEKQREQRKKEEARKQAEEKKRVEAEKVRLAEKKRKEEEKKKTEEEARKVELEKQRKLEEKKRKDEELARQKAEAKAKEVAEARKKEEEKKKAEAERKRKAEAKARADRKAREDELAAQYAAEQDASEMQQVVGLITSKVERNWLRPPGTGELGLSCTVRVRLGGTGSVLLVNVVKSSGNSSFDRSVEAAVRKADPLPMPQSKRLLAQFREIEFVFEPGN